MSTSLHGLVYFFTRRSFRAKQFWVFAITFTFITCLYHLVLTGKEHFITKPTVAISSYNIRKSVKFPPVIVCLKLPSHTFAIENVIMQNKSAVFQAFLGYLHYNPIYSDVRKVLSENLTEAFLKYPLIEGSFKLMLSRLGQAMANSSYNSERYQNLTLEEILGRHLEQPTKQMEFGSYLYGSYGAVLDNNVALCMFKGRSCTDQLVKISNCRGIDDSNRTVTSPSESLHLVLTLNSSDSDPHASNALSFIVGTSDSFHYCDHRANVEVMPGYSYDLGLRTITTEERSGTTDCIPTGELGHFEHIPEIGGYAYLGCLFECREVLADRACNCTRRESALFHSNQNGTICSEFDTLFCSHAIDRATEMCAQRCRPQCSYTYNEVLTRMAKFPSRSAYKSGSIVGVNRSKYSYEYLRQNGVELNIHFSTLTEIKLVIKLKYTFIDTIGAFGGLGGLMVGASLITSLELLFFAYDVVCAMLFNSIKQ